MLEISNKCLLIVDYVRSGILLNDKDLTKRISIVIIAFSISLFTYFLPIFTSLPRFIYKNIIGNLIIISVFGTGAGCCYTVLVNIITNLLGNGGRIQISQIFQKVIRQKR